MCYYCDTPNDNGDYDPCCYHTGHCRAHYLDSGIGNCICCGGEMFEEDGIWYHHTQKEIPPDKRYNTHFQQPRPDTD